MKGIFYIMYILPQMKVKRLKSHLQNKKSEGSDCGSWFLSCLTKPPKTQRPPFCSGPWLSPSCCCLMVGKGLLSSDHHVFILLRKERKNKVNCHPCLTPFIREVKFFQKCPQHTSSYIFWIRMKSHDELLSLLAPDEVEQTRNKNKD